MQKQVITTSNGAPFDDNQNSLSVGPRGPLLMQDFNLMDKMAHFARERIPERVVHAKGAGAHGFFEVTDDVSKYVYAFSLTKFSINSSHKLTLEYAPLLGTLRLISSTESERELHASFASRQSLVSVVPTIATETHGDSRLNSTPKKATTTWSETILQSFSLEILLNSWTSFTARRETHRLASNLSKQLGTSGTSNPNHFIRS